MRYKDITGQKFSFLTAVKFIDVQKGHARWLFKCDCGNEKIISAHTVLYGHTMSCGCYQRKLVKKLSKFIDITGKKFGKLTAIKFLKRENGSTWWLFKCDCGNMHISRLNSVTSGGTVSCGCYGREQRLNAVIKHGMCTPEKQKIYKAWYAMKDRCYNPKNKRFVHYGERGIFVCDEWINSVENFADWAMKNGYSEKLTLDRIDNDKGYSPENCRWTTYIVQNRNRRRMKQMRTR